MEDDDLLSRAYRDGFEKAGFTVMIATDGAEAEEILQNTKPDLIVLDLVMPVKNGFEVLKDLQRKKEEYRHIPVVVLSVLAEQGDIESAHDLGAIDYLIKSQFSMQEIINRIIEHVRVAREEKK
ncbi:MAG: two-component system, OmpR family, phosphate regulon response regulator PhoB [Parcubacteria group bacterium Gr01-1014_70]|nr:MAG: two-component system, OmpR family, phosphate regulon response regulator PhoB [Parcubacteria group bacterium Gr01-1014_70]